MTYFNVVVFAETQHWSLDVSAKFTANSKSTIIIDSWSILPETDTRIRSITQSATNPLSTHYTIIKQLYNHLFFKSIIEFNIYHFNFTLLFTSRNNSYRITWSHSLFSYILKHKSWLRNIKPQYTFCNMYEIFITSKHLSFNID